MLDDMTHIENAARILALAEQATAKCAAFDDKEMRARKNELWELWYGIPEPIRLAAENYLEVERQKLSLTPDTWFGG